MRKNIDLSDEAVKAITIQAINENTVFKLKAEQILEDYAKPFKNLKNFMGAWAKNIYLKLAPNGWQLTEGGFLVNIVDAAFC